MTALLAGLGAGLAVLALRRPSTESAIAVYVAGHSEDDPAPIRIPNLRRAVPGACLGSIAGWAVLPLEWWSAALIGALVGSITHNLATRRIRARKARRLGRELPAVADFLALYILSGETVLGSLRHLVAEASGEAADEIRDLLHNIDSGTGVSDAIRSAARSSSHPDGSRMLELLGEAHRSGARLVDALQIFAADRRAAIGRAITAEGGRRALTGYGPILGLMIPTTLVFLMYPTLAGLDALAAGP